VVFHRVITDQPPNSEVTPPALTGDTLSQREMYVRSNFALPLYPPKEFEVVVPGKRPRVLTPDMLAPFPGIEIDLVLECAGNGRGLLKPTPEGVAWLMGAASPISVRGVRLSDVLGPLPEDVTEIVFTGSDRGTVPMEREVPYQFSIGRELAQSKGPILATHIGGEPLSLLHGGPVRLIVPGHYAMKSVKWLTRVEAVTTPFAGHFVRQYRFFDDEIEPDGSKVADISVRSVISSPFEGETIHAPVEVRGSAWSGSGEVSEVEVSLDGGETWHQSDLARRMTGGRWAPVKWAVTIEAETGPLTIMARARDSNGAVQPLESRRNLHGYANNVVHSVAADVV
jgi:DMSO/TMAO reductase YedYZ molybdopterin-dependent catalytic subunit